MTFRALAISSRFILAVRSTAPACGSPQGTGPLPATGEACFSVGLL